MNIKHVKALASVGFAVVVSVAQSAPALAVAGVPSLGSAGTYTVLGTNANWTSGTVTLTNSTINGDVGSSATSITNTSSTINGATHAPVAGSVIIDFNNAYSALNSLNPVCNGVIPTVTTTLTPGVYCSAAGTTINTGVTLTLNGNASDVWVFKVGTTGGSLTGTGLHVVMGGTALACNVYWWTQGAATMTDSAFLGTILSGSDITLTRGSYLGRAMATGDVTVTDLVPMNFAGCAAPASIIVNKDFIPNNPATVPVALTCSSGVVTNTPQGASEATSAVFTVGGADLVGTTCKATETVPAGYAANQAGCLSVALNGTCTITNTLNANTHTITVFKDFIPNSPAVVSVALTCGGTGTVNVPTLPASEGAPAVFTVTGATAGDTCHATEPLPPAGYAMNDTACASVALDGSCTITNTLNANTNTITVYKDFIPNSPAAVSVTLSCGGTGTVNAPTLPASEGAPAVFTVTGATAGDTCHATETTAPAGYTRDETGCLTIALNGSCTITNTRNSSTITVYKNFIPDNSATVPVALTCSSGTVTIPTLLASETAPALFTVTGASPGAVCKATETVPTGYTANQTSCLSVALDGSCTITNTQIPPSPQIPALSGWAEIIFVALLALLGLAAIRRFTN